MIYEDFKDLAKRIASHKIMLDKSFNIAKNSKYGRYQSGPASMVFKFSMKILRVVLLKIKSCKIKS